MIVKTIQKTFYYECKQHKTFGIPISIKNSYKVDETFQHCGEDCNEEFFNILMK